MINVNVLEQANKSKVVITGIKITMKCPVCWHEWGVWLANDGHFPYKWDTCINCAEKRSKETIEKLNSL
jgi:hypothetical protein